MRCAVWPAALGTLLLLLLHTDAARAPGAASPHALKSSTPRPDLLNPSSVGYLPVDKDEEGQMFYMFFEARKPVDPPATVPIILWLQGGPGCSSLFGTVYLNGPYSVQKDLSLQVNHASWNERFGLLYVDQPIGTGFSTTGNAPIPTSELQLASHLYTMLQHFYRANPAFKDRPLYITGESYAGKYAPSLAHYILQADALANGYLSKLEALRRLPDDIEAPVFKLGGMAIGNGFTDAKTQIVYQAEVAWNMGLIDSHQRAKAEALQVEVVELVDQRNWGAAKLKSDLLMAYITNASGLATLEDVRRASLYDAKDMTARYLNIPEVKAQLKVDPGLFYEACSTEVGEIMGHDVMKSVKFLIPDILAFKPVLLYQGQWDAECGFSPNDAWITNLVWKGDGGFRAADRELWMNGTDVLGYWKVYHNLAHVVIRNSGHMVPHDKPFVGQEMIESWIHAVHKGKEPRPTGCRKPVLNLPPTRA